MANTYQLIYEDSLFFMPGKGLEPLGRSVKKTVLRTVFSDGSCGSSSVWLAKQDTSSPFGRGSNTRVPPGAPKKANRICGWLSFIVRFYRNLRLIKC